MELFSIACTTCRARLKVRDRSAIGLILACPKCGSMVQVTPPPGWDNAASADITPKAASEPPVELPATMAKPPVAVPAPPTTIEPPSPAEPASAEIASVDAATMTAEPLEPLTPPAGYLSPAELAWRKAASYAVFPLAMVVAALVTYATLRTLARPETELAGGASPAEQTAPIPPPDTASAGSDRKTVATAEHPSPADQADSRSLTDAPPAAEALPGNLADQPTRDTLPPVVDGEPSSGDAAKPPQAAALPEVPPRSEPATDEPANVANTDPAVMSAIDTPLPADPATSRVDSAVPRNALLAPVDDQPASTEALPPAAWVAYDIEPALNFPIGELNVSGMQLIDFVRLVEQLAGVPITIDTDSLASAGVSLTTTISVHVADATVAELLDAALDRHNLRVTRDRGQLVILASQTNRGAPAAAAPTASDKLKHPVTASFGVRTPLPEVATHLEQASGVTLLFDWRALAREGRSVNSEATLVSTNEPLSAALERWLTPLGLVYRLIDSEVVEITTPAAQPSAAR